MAIAICKGTSIKQDISSTLTVIAQIIGFTTSGTATETFEADTLDNSDAGIPMKPTGRATGGTVSGEMFLDPALAGHKSMLSYITTPAVRAMSITYADTGASVWTFNAASHGIDVTVALADGLKASFNYTLDGLPSYPA